ncbi:hypothetical protein PROFUN_12877 [Planoprotostelium fungivorum]|uniref:ZZ-type domain-containing protein n=1 Tax=Planoprotostelium fungivorum TaxID=1890364 RepID=A0A2P6N6D3_9EUKA|nr:hypothetical protein PROFUN_12877 [Planoprotostelium fungivorum]
MPKKPNPLTSTQPREHDDYGYGIKSSGKPITLDEYYDDQGNHQAAKSPRTSFTCCCLINLHSKNCSMKTTEEERDKDDLLGGMWADKSLHTKHKSYKIDSGYNLNRAQEVSVQCEIYNRYISKPGLKMDETETYTEANARDTHCSHCGEIIVGAKRRCENCLDYTLCSTCMERQEQCKIHPAHIFNESSAQSVQYKHVIPLADPTFHHSAYCDHCGTTILGIRYKCKECSNYDLCMTCIKLKDTVHPNHTYTAMDKTSYGCVSGDSTNLRMTARELNNLITSETAVAKLWKPPNNRLLVHFIVLDYG